MPSTPAFILGVFILLHGTILFSNSRESNIESKTALKSDTVKAQQLIDKASECSDAAKYDSAALCYDEAAKIYKKVKNWEKYIHCRNSSFVEIRMKHDNSDLMPLTRENLSLAKKHLSNENPVTGNCYANIGHVFADRNAVDSAIWYFSRALEIWKLHYNEKHEKIANGYSSLGIMYCKNAEYEKAEEYYKKSLSIRLELFGSDHPDVAQSYNSLGYLSYFVGRLDDCLNYYQKSLEIRREYYGEIHPITAESYNNTGVAYIRREDYNHALEYYNKALEIRLATLEPTNRNIALSYSNLGVLYSQLGDYDLSDEYHQKALKIRIEALGKDDFDVAASYINIGSNNLDRGDYLKALGNFNEVLRIWGNIFGYDHPNTSDAYNNIGAAYTGLGDYNNAFSYFLKSKELREKVGPDNPALASSYNNLGAICKYRGDYDLALSYYQKDLDLLHQIYSMETLELATSCNNLGEISFIRKDYPSALSYFYQCKNIRKRLQGEKHPDLASSYLNIAAVYGETDSLQKEIQMIDSGLYIMSNSFGEVHPTTCDLLSQKAANLLEQEDTLEAITLQKKAIRTLHSIYAPPHPDIAKAYKDLGDIFLKIGMPDSSVIYYQRSLEMNIRNTYPGDLSAINYIYILDELIFLECLIKMGEGENQLWKRTGDLATLRNSNKIYQTAIQFAAYIRENYTLDESKILLLNNLSGMYTQAIAGALEQYRFEKDESSLYKGFYYSEKSKSEVLLESIRRCHVNNYYHLPDSLLEQEKEIKSQINFFKTRVTELQTIKSDSATVLANYFNTRLANTILHLDAVKGQINKYKPSFNDTVHMNDRFEINQIREKLNSSDALISYHVGDSSLFIFVLTNDTLFHYSTTLNFNLDNQIAQYLENLKKFDRDKLISSSHFLYNVLIKPAENYLTGIQRLIIIPDKSLLYLPFEALIKGTPQPGQQAFSDLHYLMNDFEITYHYSVSLWSETKERKACPNTGFLGFAPVFNSNGTDTPDKRTVQKILNSSADQPVRSSFITPENQFSGLPYSREEMDAILALFEKKNLPARAYMNETATESNVKEYSNHYKYIHLATHGFANSIKPDLSGLVFISNSESQATGEVNSRDIPANLTENLNDGILFANEIYDLTIDADLVVLSACETGIGKMERGEGMMSLNRGFLYAGARNIVYSYWKVNDKYTSELMKYFYSFLLEGTTYSKALQLAKLRMLENEESAYPLYWAGFALIGR